MRDFEIPDRLIRNCDKVRAMGPPSFTGKLLLDYMARRIGWPSYEGKVILDIGCGSRFTDAITQYRMPLGRYIGVDIDRELIEWLSANVRDPRLSYIWLDEPNPAYGREGEEQPVDALSVAKESVDVACMFSVITHQNPADALKMFKRAALYVKPSGFLIFSAKLHDGPEREAVVTEFVRVRLSERTEVPADQIDVSSKLIELGLRSIDAVLLCGEVEDHFEVELDPSTIFEHETLGDFVLAVVERIKAQ